jgi:hypothetical protein
MSLTCFVHWSCSASLDHSVFRYTAEDHLYMESSAGAAAFNVALEGMAPALRNMFKELLAVARQDGTFYCFQSLVRQVEAAPRYSVKTCAAESVLPLASRVVNHNKKITHQLMTMLHLSVVHKSTSACPCDLQIFATLAVVTPCLLPTLVSTAYISLTCQKPTLPNGAYTSLSDTH